MPLPNFLIIGAPKCGTTSLQAYLSQHRDFCFSKYKEPNYFAFAGETLPEKGPVEPKLMQELIYFHSLTDLSQYEHQYDHHKGEKVIGDASVRYLYTKPAAERIRQLVPQARMVAILREPVSRLYSHYCMNKQYQLEPLSLMQAIEAEPDRIAQKWGWDWHYTSIGRYSEQIARYFSLFDRDQIKFFLYEEFSREPLRVMSEICRFLEVDEQFKPDMSKRGKVAYWPRNLALDRWIVRDNPSRRFIESFMSWRVKTKMHSVLLRLNGAPVPKIDAGDQRQLEKLFHQEARDLGDLLGRSIPWYQSK